MAITFYPQPDLAAEAQKIRKEENAKFKQQAIGVGLNFGSQLLNEFNKAAETAKITYDMNDFTLRSGALDEKLNEVDQQVADSGQYQSLLAEYAKVYQEWDEEYKDSDEMAYMSSAAWRETKRNSVLSRAEREATRGLELAATTNLMKFEENLRANVKLAPSEIYDRINSIQAMSDVYLAVHKKPIRARNAMQKAIDDTVSLAVQESSLTSYNDANDIFEDNKDSLSEDARVKTAFFLEKVKRQHASKLSNDMQDATAITNLLTALDTDVVFIDKRNPEVKRAVDLTFAKLGNEMPVMQPLIENYSREDVAIKTGYLNRGYVSLLAADLESGTFDDRMSAAQRIIRLNREMPATGDKIPLQLAIRAQQLQLLASSQGDTEEGRKHVMSIFSSQKPQQPIEKFDRSHYYKWLNPPRLGVFQPTTPVQTLASEIFQHDILGGLMSWSGDTNMPADMSTRFNRSSRDAFETAILGMGIPEDQAIKFVKDHMLQRWGEATTIGGDYYAAEMPFDKVMRDVKREWYNKELKTQIESLKLTEDMPKINPKDIRLYYDSTAADSSVNYVAHYNDTNLERYMPLWHKNEDGTEGPFIVNSRALWDAAQLANMPKLRESSKRPSSFLSRLKRLKNG